MTKYNKVVVYHELQNLCLSFGMLEWFFVDFESKTKSRKTKQKYQTETQRKTSKMALQQKQQYGGSKRMNE